MKAIEMCTNRFDDDTKNSFVELYTKVDAGASADSIIESQKQAELDSQIKEDNDSESEDEEDDKDVI
jgi:Ran GTPase-activating protein (RanGAP) involved in mRNA processing and transport